MPPADPRALLAPTAEQRAFLLRVATMAGHRGPSQEEMEETLAALLAPVVEAKSGKGGSNARGAFGAAAAIARSARAVNARVTDYVGADDLAEGRGGLFDSRSLGCWLALAARAGTPHVPARAILRIPEPLLDLVIDPEAAEAPARDPSTIFKLLDGLSGGALEEAFGGLTRLPPEEKRRLHALALAMLEKAGESIPPGWMVRHDHMGPGTLKAWAGVGWAPRDGDDGVTFDEGGRRTTFGPGWLQLGNRRFVDVTDARTVAAVGQAMVFEHTFWARPWVQPARRFPGFDPHRPPSWPAEMRRAAWPAEWRVFLRGGRAVAACPYYAWAEVADTPENAAAARAAMDAAQRIADAAAAIGAVPDEPRLDAIRRRSAEAREMLPEGTVCAALDFIETADGPALLEGAPPYAPGGFGAHPCAFAGARWPEGVRFALAEGVDIANPRTWGDAALAPPK
jgi:hypothetical protein